METPTAALPPGDPKTSVEAAITACRAKDGNELARWVLGGVADAELEALFARGRDVQLLTYTVPEAGDRVSVSVRLLIARESGPEEVERTWVLEQGDDGAWRFTSLPDCF